ncbi:MAG: sugar ABC transporter ATP-binding protein [Polyangiales bacterium]
MNGIGKRFPGVVALKNVSLTLSAGEVLALMGENGAGKSTLMKILGGAYAPDEGEILIKGRPVAFASVRDAKRTGIALIHQELMLAPNLDIAANIFLGNEPSLGSRGRPRLREDAKAGAIENRSDVDRSPQQSWAPAPLRAVGGLVRPLLRGEMHKAATALIARVGMCVPSTTEVSQLTPGQMQMVEIAKALSFDARILVMDEPTSSLTAGESQNLFHIIRQLRADGIGIVYISHRMEEVLSLSDRIVVLRDGQYIGEMAREEASHEKIVGMMVGRQLNQYFPPKSERAQGEPTLVVRELMVPGASKGVSFTAHRGEILGFAGLVGAGRTELMQTLFGVTPALAGSMSLAGAPFLPRRAADAIKRGVYLAPEDRKRHGLVLPMTVAENTSLPDVSNYNRFGFLQRSVERRVATSEVSRLRIKTPNIFQRVVNLSGGNQQKVVLAKWLAMKPRVLILDEPTRGIDVGAKSEIYQLMATLAAEGMIILMVSSDMEEVIGMSDRTIVMHERRISGTLSRAELTEERIATLMTGKIGLTEGGHAA